MTNEEVKSEIDRLKKSPYVKLAKKGETTMTTLTLKHGIWTLTRDGIAKSSATLSDLIRKECK